MTSPHHNVLYIALGPLRVRAAERHTARLAAAGAQVTLVVADIPEWGRISPAAGVTLHKVAAGTPRAMQRAARRFVLGAGGPLRDADLLIAGDPHALPVAWAATGARPDLTVRFEPSDGPERRPAPADLAVVTPWYPSPNNALAGAFVRAMIGAVGERFERVSILHTEDSAYPYNSPSANLIGVAVERLAGRPANAVVVDSPEGELTRVAVPIPSRRDYAGWAKAHMKALRDTLPTGQIEAPVVHAHTGIYGGFVAARLARPDARIVVTEHATFLPAVFAQPAARRLYEEMLHRVDVLLCVSHFLYDAVREAFPHYVDKLRIVPNVIDFDDFVVRPTPPQDLLRWLYLGRMAEHKGVLVLLEAFARIASEEPRATLTLVGSGALDDAIRTRIQELELADRIELRPPVSPDEVAAVMHGHDLLVHASRLETFGMTVVEAVASGMPVLVARSEGPAETLAGMDGKAGLLVDVSDDPEVIAEGWRQLRARLGALDLPAARESLLARYGREAVAAQLLEAYQPRSAEAAEVGSTGTEGAPAASGAVVAAPSTAGSTSAVPLSPEPASTPTDGATADPAARILMVAINPPRINQTRDFVHRMMARGFAVDLITNEPTAWQRARLNDGVRLHALATAEGRRPMLRIERLLVYRIPGKLLAIAQRLSRKAHPIWPELAVAAVKQGHERVANAFHNRVFFPGYKVVRSRIMWRIARRDVMPKLDLAHTRRVVVSGANGVTIGWQIARRHPQLTVTTSLTSVGDDS